MHGRPPELWALIEEAGLSTYERTGDFLQLEDGQLSDGEGDEREQVLQGLECYAGPDRAFAEYAAGLGLPWWQIEAATGYVEGFNAADAREASVLALGRQQRAGDEIEGDRIWRIREGYDRLPEFLRTRAEHAGAKFVFGASVREIVWSAGSVRLACSDGRSFESCQAVISLPLGVLQQREAGVRVLRFEPEPAPHLLALDALRMGSVCRVTMLFRRPLWPAGMSFLLAPELQPAVWWTAHPAPGATLTGWTGGPRAAALLLLPLEALRETAVRSLAKAFQLDRLEVAAELLAFETHDWSADPLSLGAYSWVPVGVLETSATLADPIESTLFLAGEHTDQTGHWGTVHAAYQSGLRAAGQVLGLPAKSLRAHETDKAQHRREWESE